MRFTMRRRLFCRVTFCILCLLPTLVIGGVAMIAHTPAYRAGRTARWQSRLSARLGLKVVCSRVEWVGDGRMVAYGIQLQDPETRACLARARSATLIATSPQPVIRVGQPELSFQRLPRLVEVLHEHLMLRRVETGTSFHLSTSTLVLSRESGAESVLDVQLVLDVHDAGTEAFLEFRPTEATEEQRVRLRMVRNRQLTPPATGWELHTGSAELPCHLVLAGLPALKRLGDTCVFQGSVWSEQRDVGWEAEISGTFRELDLDRLVTGQFPHKLSGMAELAFSRMIVHRGRLVEARGKLCSSGGVVSQTLIEAAREHLALERCPPVTEAMLLRYQDLFVEFSLDKEGLAIAGRDDKNKTILADFRGPLLTSPGSGRVAPQALARFLVPLAEMTIPASKETIALLQTLPLPEVTPAGTDTARTDYAPLKLRR